MKQTIYKLLHKITRQLESKIEASAVSSENHKQEKPAPENLEELLSMLRRTSRAVLSDSDRQIVAAAMSFKDRQVKDIMLPRTKITFVHENDFMGPLTLDKLYRSGYSHFPVVGEAGRIVGVLHTDALNSLEVRETDRASEYLDPSIYYLRDDYSLEQALAAFLRTNCFFFIVINQMSQVVGMVTYDMFISYLLGKKPEDDFTMDTSSIAVAHRK